MFIDRTTEKLLFQEDNVSQELFIDDVAIGYDEIGGNFISMMKRTPPSNTFALENIIVHAVKSQVNDLDRSTADFVRTYALDMNNFWGIINKIRRIYREKSKKK